VEQESHSFCEWIVLNGYCIASWVKWRYFASPCPEALRSGPSVTFYRAEASAMAIFRQLGPQAKPVLFRIYTLLK
jgi:hypothetical protein